MYLHSVASEDRMHQLYRIAQALAALAIAHTLSEGIRIIAVVTKNKQAFYLCQGYQSVWKGIILIRLCTRDIHKTGANPLVTH